MNSPRLRLNHNFHDDLADPINRMLNALEPGTYLQPHKHENPDKLDEPKQHIVDPTKSDNDVIRQETMKLYKHFEAVG